MVCSLSTGSGLTSLIR
ncbi:hypothetical protein JMJ77_0013679 [Colletotrichum scovillei]|uniref:Uncharacterized protein n=1 Tax=Colletotrichum scovillei TaxID=1209932 RepID=A0A9P7QQE9_9PEZI|nr:hypothetical protein JMJ78_0012969 [Colletotrichum scovillei]KAG7040682.1 hypothetical protein JMJ77_0013679 [Colletotrichum scovillei]KAG7060729.1 hypothetical protein JMJ76_0006272 [Colletotrichum scovillei]